MSDRDKPRTILFRFVGRFVFAQPKEDDGTLSVLAVNMQHARDVQSANHRVTMAISSGCVDPLGSCRPDLKCISAASVEPECDTMGRIEQLLCFLDGHEVRVSPYAHRFEWPSSEKGSILTFDELTDHRDSNIDPTYANNVAGPTAALIRFGDGVARSVQKKSESLETVRLRLAAQAASGYGKQRPDMVEIRLDVGPGPYAFSISGGAGGRHGLIRVLTEPYISTVITISNLCTHSSFENFDAEFAALYEVLRAPQAACERKVPKQVADLNAKIDCHASVHGTY